MTTDTNNYVRIFDTTLRDGEQSPGATLTSHEKIEVARMLARLGVDIIEAGFPIASPDDFEAVRRIAAEVGNTNGPGGQPPIICGLARASTKDIDAAWNAVKEAARPRIHTFIATSPIHMKYKLRMDPEEVIERAVDMVSYAKQFCDDIEFSPEDAGRSDPEFLYVILAEAIKAGATTLNIPDTVGYTTPEEFGALIRGIRENTLGIENVIISTHCHDDLGLATANTLAGVAEGARQVEVTINGIGERAGNTSLEEVVMALKTRKPIFDLDTGIDTTQIIRASKMVSSFTGIPVQPNKAIVGENAFAHEAGIHQDGMLKHAETYEIMRPEDVGVASTKLVLGKHSGRHALQSRLIELGYELERDELQSAFARFKRLADKKKVITDADLEAVVMDELRKPDEVFKMDGLQVACGTMGLPTATVRMVGPDGQIYIVSSTGTGPVDAAYAAIDKIVGIPTNLVEFAVNAVTEGIDALGEVSVRVEYDSDNEREIVHPQHTHQGNKRTFGGHGASTDIIVAAARAYLAALNRIMTAHGYNGSQYRHTPEVKVLEPDGVEAEAVN